MLLHQELAHLRQVALVHDAHVGEVSFTLFALLGQDVTLVSMFSFNLPCSGKGEPFFGTGISLNFWHFVNLFKKIINNRGPGTYKPDAPFSLVSFKITRWRQGSRGRGRQRPLSSCPGRVSWATA